MIFQITGYPRSGTAWLTAMFNLSKHSIAFHELAMTDSNWRGTVDGWVKKGLSVGDIGTYQYLPRAVIHNSKKVFIKRCLMDSVNSIEKAIKKDLTPETSGIWIGKSQNWIAEWNPLVVEYEDLFQIETLQKIWFYCLGDNEFACFPDKKVEQLLKFNIQLHEPAKALANPGAITRLAELL